MSQLSLFSPSLADFDPLVGQWFQQRFGGPTDARLGWAQILAGRHTLIAAPTGSGKTLAAFLASIDRLIRAGRAGELEDTTYVVYISPLKALSNDIRRNLEQPLAELRELAASQGDQLPPIRAQVRTGDTPAAERQAMVRRPPHILVTTPESLYLLLTSPKGRAALQHVETVIVDEIHALARDKRGSHLTLSLERLEVLSREPVVRIGLSATQRPLDEVARFLVGSQRVDDRNQPDCALSMLAHTRFGSGNRSSPTPLAAVCSHETWDEIYAQLAGLIEAHRSTLIFVNTRRLAERVSQRLIETLGEDAVASHHGSLSRQIRLAAEERLKTGKLRAIVATASLELGIDIGFIDLVCQIGSPRSIATLLQRVGRSGHALGLVPKGRLFPLTRDELIECLALARAVQARDLDAIIMPKGPLDVLAQQIVAAASVDDWDEDELFALCRRAWPFRDLTQADFQAILLLLSEGFTATNRHGIYLHRDQINRRVRARRGARIAAVTSGGTIPETGDFRVVLGEERTFIGTVNEDFALESLAGDVFLLGNNSWRIRAVRGGEVLVDDAHGAPATVPFWLGEAPARTAELSSAVSQLRREVVRRLSDDGVTPGGLQPSSAAAVNDTAKFLTDECGASASAAQQTIEYIAAGSMALGVLPTDKQIVFERFFDESGGMQLVIHAPLGARINRAWGLALRKRFCRSFDFELQASATDNGILLSLGPQHSFPIDALFKMLNEQNAESLLVQALLAAPLFQTRWRWNVTRALAVLRQRGGKKVPPYLQRFRADDLLAAAFPEQVGCLENHSGDVPIPDHPLVQQTMTDCLHEAMDVDGWVEVLRARDANQIEFVARDTREPSPFSHELLNAHPYAFLDDAPLEERRVRAVTVRRTLGTESGDLGRLDPAAIEQVVADAQPTVRDADELHDALLSLGTLPATPPWQEWFESLLRAGRVTRIVGQMNDTLWTAAERMPMILAALDESRAEPVLSLPESIRRDWESAAALVGLLRGQMQCAGPVTAEQLAARFGLPAARVGAAARSARRRRGDSARPFHIRRDGAC